MDKIAIISDIHGNLEALKEVFLDIEERGIDKIYCLGDIIAKGSHQQECVDLIREKCDVVIKGNCDYYFTSMIDLDTKSDEEAQRIIWNKKKINLESAKFLHQLPYCYEFYMSGRLVRLVHAHPAKIDKVVANIDQIEKMYELFLPSNNTVSDKKADVLIYGHIHMQYLQKLYNRTIMNVGSVGNAVNVIRDDERDGNIKNTTVANYAIISGKLDTKNVDEKISFELVSVPYNIEKELKDMDNIEYNSYKKELTEGKFRNMKKE